MDRTGLTGHSAGMDTIGKWMRTTREARGWSQDELGFRSHVGPRRIGAFERGENTPSLRLLTRIAEALGEALPWSDLGETNEDGGTRVSPHGDVLEPLLVAYA